MIGFTLVSLKFQKPFPNDVFLYVKIQVITTYFINNFTSHIKSILTKCIIKTLFVNNYRLFDY